MSRPLSRAASLTLAAALTLPVLSAHAQAAAPQPAAAQPPAAQPPAAQAPAAAAPRTPAPQDWTRRSDENTRLVLDVMARFAPEGAGRLGVAGLDEAITDITAGWEERADRESRKVLAELRKRRAAEKHPQVRQDLDILIESLEQDVRGNALGRKYSLPYMDVGQTVFSGIRSLLDDQVAPERRAAALVRLRKYAGLEPGTRPFAELAEERLRERLGQKRLQGPFRAELERDLSTSAQYLEGLGALFARYQLSGHEEALARLKEQVAAYNAFLEKELKPRARTDFRLPSEVYAHSLRTYGVDLPPARLAAMARRSATELQAQMQTLAAQVAKERGLSVTDYRDVIRELKKQQLVGDAILPHYQQRLAQLEDVVRREQLVTLPQRPARIRLATPAETAQTPAPHMRPPRLLGNTGEQGEFVLPLNVPAEDGKELRTDDFTFEAASWTLTAHEARPGHEMQFAKVLEAGVSQARAVFAFNSTNVEGWGLYAEKLVQPFLPPEGQLIALQHRLLRATRAYVDPELQLGKLTPAQVKAILMNDVVLSEAMATQEVDRYTFRAPGQATSYFYGYTRLLSLREEVEKRLGKAFEQKAFHDYILGQGLLPPELLREVVLRGFVSAQVSGRGT